MVKSNNKYYLAFEFVLLFIGIPLFIFFDPGFIHPSSVALPALIVIVLILRFSTDFKFKDLFRWKVEKNVLSTSLTIVFVSGLLLLMGVFLLDNENLFNLPKGNTTIWILLSLFYPIFSALAQEVIYRTYIFKRYNKLFTSDNALILASAITFSFVHIVYFSWLSLALTFVAGLFLARIYSKTGNVLLVALLHGLWGDIVFTIGMGQYFWLDMYQWL